MAALAFFQAGAQVVTTESFDATTFPPAGWMIKPAMTTNIWIRVTNGTSPTATPHSGNGMARFRSSSQAVATGTKQTLITKAVDYMNRGTSAANVSLWIYRDDTSPSYDSLQVFVTMVDSLDASAVWLGTICRNRTFSIPDTQAANGWYQYTFSVPTFITNNAVTRFIFQGNDEAITPGAAGQAANIFIDDINYDEFPSPCTGTPNVGNIVAQFPTICGGSGSTNLTFSNPITGMSGLSYSWESSASASGPWTPFSTNASANTGTISATTYYQCVVTCTPSSSIYTTPVDSVVVSSSAPLTVSVTPSPAVACINGTGVTITASGATNYSWSPATGLDTTAGSTVVALPTTNTQYTVFGTDSLGCSDTALVNVVLQNPPTVNITATPNDTVCSGEQVILNSVANQVPGYTYLWSDGKTTRRDTITVTATATYSVVVTSGAGCSASGSFVVTAMPAQNSGFSYTVNGNTYTFTDTTIGGTQWFWDFGDGNSSSNQNPVYTYSTPGSYTVTFIVTGPCKTDTIIVPIEVYPLGIQSLQSNHSFYCYPNPSNDQIQIHANTEILSVTIYDLNGRRVMEIMNNKKNDLMHADVSGLPHGMYQVKAVMKDESVLKTSFMKN